MYKTNQQHTILRPIWLVAPVQPFSLTVNCEEAYGQSLKKALKLRYEVAQRTRKKQEK